MSLNPPSGALKPIAGAPAGRDPASGLPLRRLGPRRHVHYDAVSTAKVQLNVLPGDVLEVSDDVARQLFGASRQFVEVDAADASAIVDSHTAREDDDVTAAEEAAAEAEAPAEKPKKRPAKKRAPQKKPATAVAPKPLTETSASATQALPAPRSTP